MSKMSTLSVSPTVFPNHIMDTLYPTPLWPDVINLMSEGVPINLCTSDTLSLWELMCQRAEEDGRQPGRTDPKPAPTDVVLTAIRAGLNKDVLPSGATAVVLAAHYGQWEWMSQLLQAGYSPDGPDLGALHALIDGRARRMWPTPAPPPIGRPGAVGVRLNIDRQTDKSAVIAAVSELITHGARLTDERIDEEGVPGPMTAMARAAWHTDVATLEGLCLSGLSPSEVPAGYVTPLECAIRRHDATTVSTLLRLGASPNPPEGLSPSDQRQRHPLVQSARWGRADLTDLLAQRMTPADLAVFGGWAMHMAAAHDHVIVMKMLRMSGVPYTVVTPTGYTLLHQAAVHGSKMSVPFLLRQGLRWEDKTPSGVTPADILRGHHPHLAKHYELPQGTSVTLMKHTPQAAKR